MPNDLMFVDTNVWVARGIEDHVFHQRAHDKLDFLLGQEHLLCTSNQIIREFISVCSLGRGLSRPLTWDELRQQIDALLTQAIFVNESEASTRKLIELGANYKVLGKQIHDTNIVATMVAHDVTYLVTFNPDDFKRFSEIEIVVP